MIPSGGHASDSKTNRLGKAQPAARISKYFSNIYFLIFSNIFHLYLVFFYISKYFLLNNIIHLEDDVAEPALLALEPELLEDGDAVVGL